MTILDSTPTAIEARELAERSSDSKTSFEKQEALENYIFNAKVKIAAQSGEHSIAVSDDEDAMLMEDGDDFIYDFIYRNSTKLKNLGYTLTFEQTSTYSYVTVSW